MSKHVLAAVDFGESWDSVVRVAAQLARATAAHLTLLHVAAPDPSFVGYDAGPQTVRDSRADELHRERRELQQRAEELEAEGLAARALLYAGPTVDTILDEARRIPADWIVVGSHGRGPVARAVLGSVSRGVLDDPPCPVVVVPQRSSPK